MIPKTIKIATINIPQSGLTYSPPINGLIQRYNNRAYNPTGNMNEIFTNAV